MVLDLSTLHIHVCGSMEVCCDPSFHAAAVSIGFFVGFDAIPLNNVLFT